MDSCGWKKEKEQMKSQKRLYYNQVKKVFSMMSGQVDMLSNVEGGDK